MKKYDELQPGNEYKVVCIDNKNPHKEFTFKFVNFTKDGKFEIEIEGVPRTVGDFATLCGGFACDFY